MAELRLALAVEVAPATSIPRKHAAGALWQLVDRLAAEQRPWLIVAMPAGFFVELRKTAEQLTEIERWYRILSEALKKHLRGQYSWRGETAGAATYELAHPLTHAFSMSTNVGYFFRILMTAILQTVGDQYTSRNL